jgi:hypothetical protein
MELSFVLAGESPRFHSGILPETIRWMVSGKNGGRCWFRTNDPLIKSQLLYQLS